MKKIDIMVDRISAPVYSKRPEPKTIRLRHAINECELEHARYDFGDWCQWFKTNMAHQIANYIVNEAGVIKMPNSYTELRGEHVIEMEFTINDASAYKNWLPLERRAGIKEGVAQGREQLKRELPYGMEPEAFYE